ncbi:MAG: hypothetical protein MN733_31450 [Nitrososphaera sp.]|nr:hypothetical protein [Nitrososphaera sp.]
MIALLLLLGLLGYIGLALLLTLFIRRRFTTSRAKWIATVVSLLVFVLIPIADDVAGKWYFDRLCQAEAKVTIYKSVNGVEGILGSGLGSIAFDEFGYGFLEEEIGGLYYRYSRGSKGERERMEVSQPASRYIVKRSIQKQPYNISKYEEVIVDQQSKESLAQSIEFSYGGGWLSQLIRRFGVSGGGEQCHDSQISWKDFYLKTLKPSRSTS